MPRTVASTKPYQGAGVGEAEHRVVGADLTDRIPLMPWPRTIFTSSPASLSYPRWSALKKIGVAAL
jgi:hypothetical protein